MEENPTHIPTAITFVRHDDEMSMWDVIRSERAFDEYAVDDSSSIESNGKEVGNLEVQCDEN